MLTPEVLKTLKMADYTGLVTMNPDGVPNLVAAWNCLPVGENILLISGEKYFQTRKNLETDPRIWILAASRELDTGFRLTGRAQISHDPKDVELVRKYWPRCSFALKIAVEAVEDLAHWKQKTK